MNNPGLKDRLMIALLGASIYGFAIIPPPAYGGTVKIKVGVRGTLSDMVINIGKEKKCFEKEGLDIRLIPLSGKIDSVFSALANGKVDVTFAAFNTNLIGFMRESGIKIVAGHSHLVKGTPSYIYYLVRKDLAEKIRTFADLKGRTVAVDTAGTLERIRLSRELDNAGLSEKDFTEKTVPWDLLPSMFVSKQIDVASAIEPVAGRIIKVGLAEPFAGTDIADESLPMSSIYYSRSFMANRQAARRFMTAFLRSIAEFRKATPKELGDIAVKIWGMPIDTEVLSKLHPDGEINTQPLMAAQEYALRRGWIKSRADEKDIVDPSYLRYASEVLRSEKPPSR